MVYEKAAHSRRPKASSINLLFHTRITWQSQLLADVTPFLLTCFHRQQLLHALVAVACQEHRTLHLMRSITHAHVFVYQLFIQAEQTVNAVNLVLMLGTRQLLRRQPQQIINTRPNVFIAQLRNLLHRLFRCIGIQAELFQLHVADAAVKKLAKVLLVEKEAVMQAVHCLFLIHRLLACGAGSCSANNKKTAEHEAD